MGLNTANRAKERKTTVFFDGSCPLCSREIRFYQNKDTEQQFRWLDVAAEMNGDLPADLSRDMALKRFHVETESGELLSGAPAFIHLWSKIPKLRILGWMGRSRPVMWFLDWAYDFSLRLRPTLQRLMN